MKRDKAMGVLRQHWDELRAMGATSLALFGSTARDDAREDSDVDLLIEFDRRVSLFDVFRVQHRLEEMLDVPKVDLVQRGAEHPALKERIHKEAIDVT